MEIYLTSDLHLGHDKDFIYKPRGFNSVDEANESIISNWNSIINEDDLVYVMEDAGFFDYEDVAKHATDPDRYSREIWGDEEWEKIQKEREERMKK